MGRTQELKRILSLAMQGSNWQDALSVLNKLVKQEENQPAYHNQIGDILLKTGKQAEAIVSFLSGVEGYNELGMYPNGAALCKKILRFEPGHREATWWLGEMKTRQGFLADGAERMLEALHFYAEDPKVPKETLMSRLGSSESLQPSNKEILEFVATAYAQIGEGVMARDVTLRVADLEAREGNREKAENLRRLAEGFCPLAEEPPVDAPAETAAPAPGGAKDTPEITIPESAADEVYGRQDWSESAPASADKPAPETPTVPAEPEMLMEIDRTPEALPVDDKDEDEDMLVAEGPLGAQVINDRKQNEEDLIRTIDGEVGQDTEFDIEVITTNMGDAPEAAETADDVVFEIETATDATVSGVAADDEDVDLEILPTQQPEDIAAGAVNPTIALQEAMDAMSDDGDMVDLLELTVHGLKIETAGDHLTLSPGDAETEASAAESDAPAAGNGTAKETPAAEEAPIASLDQFMARKEKPLSLELTTTIGEAMQTDDIEKVLAEFRDRMASEMGDMSAEEHYQLGVSYMEMDLFAEALQEFEYTLNHPMLSIKSREWMARCFLSLNQPWDLIEMLGAYLDNESYPRKSLVELYYLIGQAYQAVDRPDMAVNSFTKVYSLDTEFKDVKARLELLTCRE